jgi:hypothetical protein
MVELVDTLVLGTSAFGRAGSNPVSGNPACQDMIVEVIAKIILDTRCDSSYGPPEAH